MAAYGWRRPCSVEDGLLHEGHRFSFLQAVHLLERMRATRTPADAERTPLREVVRFRAEARLDFAPSDVEDVRAPESENEPVEMSVNVLSLVGPMSPLPPHITELVMARASRKDKASREFLNIFNDRLIALFYRAREKYRPALDLEAPARGRVARVLFAILGLGAKRLQSRMHVPDRSLLAYAGLIADRRRSSIGLSRFLSDCFGVDVEIVPFQGAWDYIDEDDLTRIGESGQNQILGESATLGRRVWDQAARFEIRLGPLSLREFLSFLPKRGAYAGLLDATRFYVREELGFTVRLVLKRDEVPVLKLTNQKTVRLGWTSWLHTKKKPVPHDDSQVRLRGLA